jgi:hypothetical protein
VESTHKPNQYTFKFWGIYDPNDPTPEPGESEPSNPEPSNPEPNNPEPNEPEPNEPGDTEPPTVPDNTVTITIPSTTNPGQQWTISITAAGGVSIPENIQFYFWFIVWNSSSSSIKTASTATYVGPFVTKSVKDTSGATALDIDVNNLIKPDGTKGSVPSGSYKIQFADSETGEKYVGTTSEAIIVEGTTQNPTPAEPDPVEPNPMEPPSPTDPDPVVPINPETPSQGRGSGGGCNTGYGLIGLLFMSFAMRKYLTL